MAGYKGGMGGNMQNIMKQAQKMQEQMQEVDKQLDDWEVVGTSGGGAEGDRKAHKRVFQTPRRRQKNGAEVRI